MIETILPSSDAEIGIPPLLIGEGRGWLHYVRAVWSVACCAASADFEDAILSFVFSAWSLSLTAISEATSDSSTPTLAISSSLVMRLPFFL